MTVLVDDRAGSRELIKYPPLDEVGVIHRLDAGDVCFSGNGPSGPLLVGVEVKSVWDLLASVNTGRLAGTQVPAMLAEYQVCWILVYGQIRPHPRTGWLQMRTGKYWREFRLGKQCVRYGYLEHALFDLTVTGFHIKQVSDVREAAYWIGALHRWWSKPWQKHKGLRRFDNSREGSLMFDNDDPGFMRRARVALALKSGMGNDRAPAAAAHFPSVESMITASYEEWLKIPGVGKVIAKETRRVIVERS